MPKAADTPCTLPTDISGTGRRTRTHISAPVRDAGPIYAIRLQARPGTDSIRALRAALKVLWRRYQLRCLDAREVKDGADRMKS